METLDSFDPQSRPTQKQLNLEKPTRKAASSSDKSQLKSDSASDSFSHYSSPDVTQQDINPVERMKSEGGPTLGARRLSSHRYDFTRRGSTGSAKADDELSREMFGSKINRRRSDVHVTSKLQLQTEELETSGMSEKEIAELAKRRAEEQPNVRENSNDDSSQPVPGLSYAAVVKESSPSQGPASSIPESILSRQAAEAIHLDHERREIEKQMEIEQVQKKEDLLVPPTPLQHPIIPVKLSEEQTKEVVEMNIENEEEQGGASMKERIGQQTEALKHKAEGVAQGLKSKSQGMKEKLEDEASHLKSNLSSTLDQLSSSVSGSSSPLQKGRETLSNALSSVKSKLPWFGNAKEQNEEEEEEEEDRDELEEEEESTGTSTLEQLKNQASHLTALASNKVSQLLPENLVPSSLKSGTSSESPSESIEGGASSKVDEIKAKAAKQVDELKNQSQQIKNQLADQAGNLKNQAVEKKHQLSDQANRLLNRGGEVKQEAMKKTGQLVQQGKQTLAEGKQLASKKLEEGKQIAAEKLNQAKQLVPQANQSIQQMAGKGQEVGQKLKKKANEMMNKKEKEEGEESIEQSKGTSSLVSLSPNWRNLLSSVTERASNLKQQAADTASQLSDKVSEKIPSFKSSGNETIETGKKQLKHPKPQAPTSEEAWEVVGKGKKKLNKLKNQAADSLGQLKEQGLAAAESSGIMDRDRNRNLHLRDSIRTNLSNLSNKLQGQSQFQNLAHTASPYVARAKSFGASYVDSYQEFLSTLRDQNYVLQLVFGLMAVMHVFIPLLFLDYPQARMVIKWFSFVAIFSHGLWYLSRSIKLAQLPNILLYPLITYLLMMSPIMGEGLNAGTQQVTSYFSEWLSFLTIPFQARSYLFTLWLRTLLMLDTAVLTANMLGLHSFINKRGGSIKQAFGSFLQSDEGKVLKKQMKEAKKEAKMMKRKIEKGYEKAEHALEDQQEEGEMRQGGEHEKEEWEWEEHLQKQPKAKKSEPAPKISALKQNKKSSLQKRDRHPEHEEREQEHEQEEMSFPEEEHEHEHGQQQQQLQHLQLQQQHQAPAKKMKKKKKPAKSQQQGEETYDLDKHIEDQYDDRDRNRRRDIQSHERPDLMKWEDDPAPAKKSTGKSELHHDHNADWSSGTGMTLSGDAATMAMQDWSMAK